MGCKRCGGETSKKWCKACEHQFDGWVRRHATDIVWQVLAAGTVIGVIGIGLPLLGLSSLVAASGAFVGFGTLYGLSRLTRHKRRQQFLASGLPRAYLPAPK